MSKQAGVSTPTFSFEVFPARSSAAALSLGHTVQALAATQPEFLAVTYGASGSSREASLELLQYTKAHTAVRPLAHVTSIGYTRAELETVIHDFLDAGITDFLALRGDVPQGKGQSFLDRTEVNDTIELVGFLRGITDSAGVAAKIAVAAYPNGHPRSQGIQQDIDVLKRKQDNGADFALTQLFFHASEYLNFLNACSENGIDLPIIPGLMPVASLKQLHKVSELSGQAPPLTLHEKLVGSSETDAAAVGIDFTVSLARQLLEGGAPGIHLYTFNKKELVLEVVRELGFLENVSLRQEHV